MKIELTDVSETRKTLSFEVPAEMVDAEILRVAESYGRTARVPGFRQGKVPVKVVRQRYKDQILSDVTHELIPRVVGAALRERTLHPVVAPEVKNIKLDEGQPLSFVADIEVLPVIEPGAYTGITLRKAPAVVAAGAVDQALDELRNRAAKWIPVEDRAAGAGDSLLLDLTRTVHPAPRVSSGDDAPAGAVAADVMPDPLQNVTIELGVPSNPPGFDDHLTGLAVGGQKAFTVTYPVDYQMPELAGATVDYDVTLKGIRRRDLPALDDDFAKEVSEFDTLDALRVRVEDDLRHQAARDADHQVRHDLLQDLAARLPGEVPEALVEREVERRLEDLVRRLMEQGIDPMKANIDWRDLRTRQRQGAESSVRSTLVLDEIARRESIAAAEADVEQEIARFAERSGRTPAAVRAHLEKEDGLDHIYAGIQREKTMTWLLDKAIIANA
jgi:trigger factor